MMLITESAVLATIGAGGGILLALAGLDALVAVSPTNLPRMDNVTIDLSVLLFVMVTAVACTLIFGLLPAFRGAQADPNQALQSGARGSTRRTTTTSRLLVAVEVAWCDDFSLDRRSVVSLFGNIREREAGRQRRGLHRVAFGSRIPRRHALLPRRCICSPKHCQAYDVAGVSGFKSRNNRAKDSW